MWAHKPAPRENNGNVSPGLCKESRGLFVWFKLGGDTISGPDKGNDYS